MEKTIVISGFINLFAETIPVGYIKLLYLDEYGFFKAIYPKNILNGNS